MTFRQKIDKILKVNTLGITSVSGLEDYLETGRQAINKFYNSDREPGRKTLGKILDLPGLSLTWWETGQGEVFCKTSEGKPTHGQNKATVSLKDINVNTLEFTVAGLRRDVEERDGEIIRLKSEMDGLRSDLSGLRADIAEVRKERDQIKKKYEELLDRTTDNVQH